MKTIMLAAIRCSLIFTAVAALSVAYPASVQAVPTTYQYTGNPFTDVAAPYTTSDFVTVMLTLAGPLAPNFSGTVTPTAFTFSDGVQTLKKFNSNATLFFFTTGPTGQILSWDVEAFQVDPLTSAIVTMNTEQHTPVADFGAMYDNGEIGPNGLNLGQPGGWEIVSAVSDAGSTLSLMTLTLMALGVAARQSVVRRTECNGERSW